MRFLADENFPGEAVTRPVAADHDVVWVRDVAPGMTDMDIIALAAREARIVLTFDKDFGELTWDAGLPASCGTVLFRLPMPRAADVGAQLAARVLERDDWAGHFAVIELGRVRLRQLK